MCTANQLKLIVELAWINYLRLVTEHSERAQPLHMLKTKIQFKTIHIFFSVENLCCVRRSKL